jgi:hypothetical protein
VPEQSPLANDEVASSVLDSEYEVEVGKAQSAYVSQQEAVGRALRSLPDDLAGPMAMKASEQLKANKPKPVTPTDFAKAKAEALVAKFPDTTDEEIDEILSWGMSRENLEAARRNASEVGGRSEYDSTNLGQKALLHGSQAIVAADAALGGLGMAAAKARDPEGAAQTEGALHDVSRQAPLASGIAETAGTLGGYAVNPAMRGGLGRDAARLSGGAGAGGPSVGAGASLSTRFAMAEGVNQLVREVSGQTKGQPGTTLERAAKAMAHGKATGATLELAGGAADRVLSMVPGLERHVAGALRSVVEDRALPLAQAAVDVGEGRMPEGPDLTANPGSTVVFGLVGATSGRSPGQLLVRELRSKGLTEAEAVQAVEALRGATEAPPVEMVRVYRGESNVDPNAPGQAWLRSTDVENRGRWFTSDRKVAEDYAGEGGTLLEVEVPRDVYEAGRSAGEPGSTVLPPDWAGRAAKAPRAPETAPAPTAGVETPVAPQGAVAPTGGLGGASRQRPTLVHEGQVQNNHRLIFNTSKGPMHVTVARAPDGSAELAILPDAYVKSGETGPEALKKYHVDLGPAETRDILRQVQEKFWDVERWEWTRDSGANPGKTGSRDTPITDEKLSGGRSLAPSEPVRRAELPRSPLDVVAEVADRTGRPDLAREAREATAAVDSHPETSDWRVVRDAWDKATGAEKARLNEIMGRFNGAEFKAEADKIRGVRDVQFEPPASMGEAPPSTSTRRTTPRRTNLERGPDRPEPPTAGQRLVEAFAPSIGPASIPAVNTEAVGKIRKTLGDAIQGVRRFFSSEQAGGIGRSNRDAQMAAIRAANAPDIVESFGELYKAEVLARVPEKDRGLFGAALVESNLRGLRDQREAELAKLRSDPNTDPAAIEAAEANVAKIRTTIGGAEFPTEAAYQAFVSRPDVQAADAAHVALRTEFVEPMYAGLKDLPDGVLEPTRGRELKGRVNLIAAEHAMDRAPGVSPKPGLGRVFRRPAPFSRRATGSAEGYRFDPAEMAQNTMSRLVEPFNRKVALDSLVKSGDAVSVPQGKAAPKDINGEAPVLVQTRVGGERIYVREGLSNEVMDNLGLAPRRAPTRMGKFIDGVIRRSLMATSADAMSTVGRGIAVGWLRGGAKRGPVGSFVMALPDFLTETYKIVESALKNKVTPRERMDMAMGGLGRRAKYDSDITDKPARMPDFLGVLSDVMGDVAVKVDNAARARLKASAEAAGLPPHEVGRIVGQLGVYSTNARVWKGNALQRAIAPFFEAWRTRMGNMGRNLTGSGQVQAEKSMLRAIVNVQARIMGIAAYGVAESLLAAKANDEDYPDIPLGAFYLGYKNEDGEPQYVDPLGAVGIRAVFNLMGEPALRAKMRGLSGEKRADAYFRGLMNTATGALSGPVANAGWVLAKGESMQGIRPTLPPGPGQSEIPSRVIGAAQTLDPKTFAYMEGMLDVLQLGGVKARSSLGLTERVSPGFMGMLKNQMSYFAARDGMSESRVKALNESIEYGVADALVKALRSELWQQPKERRAAWLEETINAKTNDPRWRKYLRQQMNHSLIKATTGGK